MLLPIGQYNIQFGRVVLDRVLAPVHRAAAENSQVSSLICMMQRHGKENHRPDYQEQHSVCLPVGREVDAPATATRTAQPGHVKAEA
jgi:hypothetical protein